MKTLIFNADLNGHYIEYMHHIVDHISIHEKDDYVFLVPKAFEEEKKLLKWPECKNLKYIYLTEEEMEVCREKKLFKASYFKSKLIRKYVKREDVDRLFLLTLMPKIPFILFFIPLKVKIRGIVYRICFWGWDNLSVIKKTIEMARYWMMAIFPNMEMVFMLNDERSADYLNQKFHTDKFLSLPDPINVQQDTFYDVREELGIDSDKKMFIHFGGLTERKGTLLIMDAILQLSDEDIFKYAFVFAGKIDKDIRDKFYQKLKIIKSRGVCIVVKDEFCQYEFLMNLCYSCNFVLIPYSNTQSSSGLIGYAAYFGKPVIGPKEGLLGELIRQHNLGYTIDVCSESILRSFILDSQGFGSKYKSINTIKNFQLTYFK